jgi:drug/metabolite transporter (DMT)-like permease
LSYLVLASLLWAFSFGLIKTFLTGLDSSLVALVRLGVSLLVFAPLARGRRLPARLAAGLLLVGAMQYGVMYLAYIRAFRYLAAHQVAVLTIFTPLYVVLLDAAARRRLSLRFAAAAALAVAGAALLVATREAWRVTAAGALLVQVSNLAFAAGQLRYRALKLELADRGVSDRDVFAWCYLGGASVAALSWIAAGRPGPAPSAAQWAILLYLGAIPSGLGFFLWNAGACRVNAGLLGSMNNLKIPLAVLASLLVFREAADPLRLGGCALLLTLALLTARRRTPTVSDKEAGP